MSVKAQFLLMRQKKEVTVDKKVKVQRSGHSEEVEGKEVAEEKDASL